MSTCTRSESLYGRCVSCGMTWEQQAEARATRERLAAVIDPDAFDDTKRKSKRNAAVLQWAARRYMALVYAERLLVAGVIRTGATPAIDREALILTLHNAGAYCGDCNYEDWDTCGDCRQVLERYADDVLALLGGAS